MSVPQPLSSLLLSTPMDQAAFLKVAVSLARELARFHGEGRVHGSLTPDEFVLEPSLEAARLARAHERPRPRGLTKGNLPYLAPERIGYGGRELDSRADLYSLGVILFQGLTGDLPFKSTDELGLFHSHFTEIPVFPASATSGSKIIERIILRLLAKDAEERYQSAKGLLHDLELCAFALRAGNALPMDFELGRHDVPDRLKLPRKLYGRTTEKARLLAAVERVRQSGKTELLLVSGYAGVGKTVLVNELYEPVVSKGGFFTTGKFDQLERGIPYHTLSQAFHGLLTLILGENDARIAYWRSRLLDALGGQGQLIINIIPVLEIIIGKQPPVPALPPLETQNRLQMVLRRFVGAFARAEHPLVIFFDDLQWADAASLALLEQFATDADMRHVLIVGAFRSNEVGDSHPLKATVRTIRKAEGCVEELSLSPLSARQLRRLVADALVMDEGRVGPLAEALHSKTDGNPFFFIQYLKALVDERLIRKDKDSSAWTWDVDSITAKAYADNVADFLLTRLRKLPHRTQRLLQYAACLGNKGRLQDLLLAAGGEDQLVEDAGPASLEGFLLLDETDYRFLHDRLQQAALALFPDEQKKLHLTIARQLAGRHAEGDDEVLFDTVSHYHAARELLTDRKERLAVARLNLAAACKAKASAANQGAKDYCDRGLELLPEDVRQGCHELALELRFVQAECLWRCGDAEEAERSFLELRASSCVQGLERARIDRILIEVDTTQGKMEQAMQRCRLGLAAIGIDFPKGPTDEELREVYGAFRASLGGRPIESLVDLPPITDPLEKAALDIMAAAIPAAIFTSANMASYLYCKMVHSSIVNGNSDAAASAYAYFSMILGSVFGEYRDAYRLGQVAYELAKRGALTWKSRIFVIVGNVVNTWTKPMRSNIPYLLAAFPAAQEAGDLAGACYCHNHLVSTLLALGEPLAEVYAKTERGLQFVRSVNYPAIADILIGQQRLVLAMQGRTRRFSGCGDDGFDEPAYEARIAASQMALLRFWLFTWKLQACFLYGQVDEALAAGEAGRLLAWSSPGHVEEAEHHFYHALALAAACGEAQGARRDAYLERIVAYRDAFRRWSDNCPENFAHKCHLIEAELARLEQRDLLAIRSYDQAIRLAKENRFIQNEAVSCELAGYFYEKAGMRAFAQQNLQAAVAAYQAWGAYGKVRELTRRFPYLSVDVQEAPVAQSIDIDLASVLRASQSISSEILPAQLSKKLMRILVEVSGAERGYLILRQDKKLLVEAVARTSPAGLEVELIPSKPIREFMRLPMSILNYTLRSQEMVLIADARVSHRFSRDKVLSASPHKSILCLPIVRNRSLVAMAYLENDLVTEAFTSDKLAVLETLAAQAAISIDNARLYAELSAEEEKWRATLESMADGLIVCDVSGRINLINDAAMRIFGFEDRDALMRRGPDDQADLLDFRDSKGVRLRRESLPLSRALRGETLTQKECHIRQLESGRARVLRLSAAPMRQSSGEIMGAVFVVQDVTESTALDRLKDEFLRAVAHELKTPLMVVTAYFELFSELAKGGGSDAQLQECAERMGGGLERLRSLIETLVDVSLIQLGRLKLRPETFDLRALCQELVEALSILSPKHRLLFEGGAAEPMLIRGDRVRLGQVLTNLLGNAIKYSPDGGDVELAIREEVGSVVVSVKDQGIGIPVERQDRLFQRFYRAHAETEHDYGGMGVGLFLAQEIVLAHHGKMWFVSEAGKGSTFYISLPQLQLKTS